MSTEPHQPKQSHESEHGTTASYIVGFILSLIFTFIPYYLVVNKVIQGNALIFTILAIAVLQMAIQLFFFLHLGRGPKPLYNIVFFFATAGIIVITVGASLFIMANLYHNMLPEEVTTRVAQEENIASLGGVETGACQGNKENHIVVIKNGLPDPVYTVANRCDTLTFVSDAGSRTFVFGTHPDYTSYGGLYEVIARSGRPEIVTLNQTGTFMFHDHDDPSVMGHFTVLQ